uniref:Uncharacterized protein n=1 Tax=Opuntia streptacantha TaxID=393608 RepID=A0A7C9EJT5_OPUST
MKVGIKDWYPNSYVPIFVSPFCPINKNAQKDPHESFQEPSVNSSSFTSLHHHPVSACPSDSGSNPSKKKKPKPGYCLIVNISESTGFRSQLEKGGLPFNIFDI